MIQKDIQRMEIFSLKKRFKIIFDLEKEFHLLLICEIRVQQNVIYIHSIVGFSAENRDLLYNCALTSSPQSMFINTLMAEL